MILSVSLYLNVLVTLLLTGAIWYMQIVHLPLFLMLKKLKYPNYFYEHQKLTLIVTGPLMVLEGILALVIGATFEEMILSGINVLLIVGVWAATFYLHLPHMQKLMYGYDQKACAGLVSSNWYRTALWSVKALLAVYMLIVQFGF